MFFFGAFHCLPKKFGFFQCLSMFFLSDFSYVFLGALIVFQLNALGAFSMLFLLTALLNCLLPFLSYYCLSSFVILGVVIDIFYFNHNFHNFLRISFK
jgi:hypothetical protein